MTHYVYLWELIFCLIHSENSLLVTTEAVERVETAKTIVTAKTVETAETVVIGETVETAEIVVTAETDC